MFELTLSQASSVLARESRFVRKAIIAKLEGMQKTFAIQKALPTNFLEALKLLVVKEEQTEALQAQVKILEHKTESTEKVLIMTDTLLATAVCKEFGFKSDIEMNKIIVEKQIIYKVRGHYMMAAKYAEKGYERYSDHEHNSKVYRQMEWIQLGRAFLHRMFNQDLSYSRNYTYPGYQLPTSN